ncbi:LysR family transcriptional regulator [Variovorax sp. dw_954]|uniref:LysR family transcriptional regulator n=1 Tax=Variovorax sp. dw_954 TaxID=2720078 RepID=UPI001BD5261E|nr:LysR family transcriptional regulator [Variovorax sp. dw_954]
MDVNLAKTFLEIASSGSFLGAAESLHLTQTAISARVRTLEESLGQKLFVRNRSGATLTPAGERFSRYALILVQAWEQARHQMAVPAGRDAVLTVGCEVSLWDPLLLQWLLWMRRAAPQLALRTEVGLPERLLNRVSEGTLDIAVVYAPHQLPGLRIELLIEEKLVMVTTSANGEAPRANDYVYVDWGPQFAAQHALAFPELSGAGVSASLGPLGREYLLAAGGAGYFRLDVVRPHLESGRLHRVPGTPEFLYPAYAVYSESAVAASVGPGLEGLRQVVRPQEAKVAKATEAARAPSRRRKA